MDVKNCGGLFGGLGHNLKSPLSAIIGIVEYLVSENPDLEDVHFIYSELKQLNTYVSDLSRIIFR
jgi:K+-sensing histidine kinase KdpD